MPAAVAKVVRLDRRAEVVRLEHCYDMGIDGIISSFVSWRQRQCFLRSRVMADSTDGSGVAREYCTATATDTDGSIISLERWRRRRQQWRRRWQRDATRQAAEALHISTGLSNDAARGSGVDATRQTAAALHAAAAQPLTLPSTEASSASRPGVGGSSGESWQW